MGQIALDCDSQSEFQQTSLQRLERAVGAESSLYVAIARRQSRWTFEYGSSHGVSEQGPLLWNQRYHKQDPFVRAFLDAPRKESPVVVSDRVISHEKLVATEFYADFLKPQSVYHVLILGLISHQRPIGLFGLHRPPGSRPFSDRDVEKARLLSPHLTAAVVKATQVENNQSYHEAIDQLTGRSSNCGVVILDRLDKPLYANSKADELLGSIHKLDIPTDNSRKDVPPHVFEFCRQIETREHRQAGGSDCERFLMHALNTDISVEVHRCKDGSGVVYLNEGCSGSTIRRKRISEYMLTNRQRAIVHLLSTGMTNPEIAEKLHISVRTVQNHLRMIYSKVDVHNRTSLVNRLSH